MTAIGLALLVFVCTFGGALFGMRLRARLREHHLSPDTKELVHLFMGLIATMTALILGLITASAKSAFDEQDQASKTAAANILTLDRTLASYGPETKAVREGLRSAVSYAVDTLWNEERGAKSPNIDAGRTQSVEQIEQAILALEPQNESQRWL